MNLERIEFNPCIVVLAGPPYSGKTTLGLELSGRTNLNFIDINKERSLFPSLFPTEGGEFKDPVTRSMAMTVAYALIDLQASKHLAEGKPVLLAATHSYGIYVSMLRRFADFHREINQLPEAALKIFVLQAPEESLTERSESRRRMNNEKYFPFIFLETAIDLRQRFIPIIGDDIVHINTGLSLEENVAQVLAELEPFKLNPDIIEK